MLIHYPEILPISAHADELIAAIHDHQVIVVAGDTGSGKTTQLPKMCLAAGLGRERLVGCTQPRRIAAVSVAERVAEELAAPDLVGYKIRFHDHTGLATRIKFMTDGILLAETRADRMLAAYDCLIIDEAHERGLNIDFLFGYCKQLLPQRSDLRLIVSSATIDTEKFAAFFDKAPIFAVSGRVYPIETRHEAMAEDAEDDERLVDHASAQVVDLVSNEGPGDVLVFLPTERDIRECVDSLRRALPDCEVLPLFGRLQARDQRKIFQPAKGRKIVVATNVAETSITVPGIRFVVDSGLARLSRYNPRARTTSLKVSRVSRAACDQRQGRCGRTGPGVCVRLFSEEDYRDRPAYTQPEIQRANLAEVILKMIDLGLGDPAAFPFLDPPLGRAIGDGFTLLAELGALDRDRGLSERGRLMARLPIDPQVSRIIVEAAALGCLSEIKIIAAALAIPDPRIRPADQEKQADAIHAQFNVKGSDFLSFVRIWDLYHATYRQVKSQGRMRKFCQGHFLSFQRMREWLDLHHQLAMLLRRQQDFLDNREPAGPEAVHQALCAGFLRNIGKKKEKNLFQAGGGREVMLFPGSTLFNQAPEWLVAANLVETSRLYARTCAAIDPAWLEGLGGELCRRSWSDPRWEKKSGQVLGFETVSLFGLVIVAQRRINYGRVNAETRREARAIFIQAALLDGGLLGRYPFLEHNRALVRGLRDEEDRLRRRDLLIDDQGLFAFYDQVLPAGVYDRFTLNRFLRQKGNEQRLRMDEERIRQVRPGATELYSYPLTLMNRGVELRLGYLFEPGNATDGVSIEIPARLLDQLDPMVFEWLVPGLLPEKITWLLKGLPKKLRRPLVPLPDSVDRLLDAMDHGRGSLYSALEQALLRLFNLRVIRADWRLDNLPEHLRFRFRLMDDQGRELASARSLHELRAGTPASAQTVKEDKSAEAGIKKNISGWDFEGLDATRPLHDAHGRPAGLAFVTLLPEKDGQTLELRYLDNAAESRARNREGLRLLYGLQFPKEVAAMARECRAALQTHWASWLLLGAPGDRKGQADGLLAFLLDDLFACGEGTIPDQEEFDGVLERLRGEGMLRAGMARLRLVLELLGKRRELSERIMDMEKRARATRSFNQERFDRYRALVDELLPPDFLRTTALADLKPMERWLRGLAIRLERAEQSPAKDAAKDERVRPFQNRLAQFHDSGKLSAECRRGLRDYRRLVEEFRLSVFAPELGASEPVSEKRLKERWREVEDRCLRME